MRWTSTCSPALVGPCGGRRIDRVGPGSIVARLCRQPVRRARVIVLTLLGAVAVPWLGESARCAEVVRWLRSGDSARGRPPARDAGGSTPPLRPLRLNSHASQSLASMVARG